MNKLCSLVIVSLFLFCNQPTDGINIYSNDLNFSKDSLKVHNNPLDTFKDQIIIKNTSDNSIILDSAFIIFDVFDSTDMFDNIEAHWMEDMYGDFGWFLNEVGNNKYKLAKDYFSPNDTAIPLRFNPKGSCVLLYLRIGLNLVSSQIPIYPKYMKGSLQLYFSNKQFMEIKLYSEDLRTKQE